MDFSKFDNQINKSQLEAQMKEAQENEGSYREIPEGSYKVKLEKMELKATKDGRPMFSVMMRITEGDFKKSCLFMNRVIYGTKNDGNMINSVIGWLKSLDTEEEVVFKNYSDFSELILDIYEELSSVCEYQVEYDPNAFNSIKITDVFDVPF